jgi:hypothetical protein
VAGCLVYDLVQFAVVTRIGLFDAVDLGRVHPVYHFISSHKTSINDNVVHIDPSLPLNEGLFILERLLSAHTRRFPMPTF